jgi:hypothetical protein
MLVHIAAFALTLTKRLENGRDTTLVDDLQAQIRGLPLQASSAVFSKQDELDKSGIELWNLSTRLRRAERNSDGNSKDTTARKDRALTLLRPFSFLLLDTAGGCEVKGGQRKSCIRLMKVALKAARVCIEANELNTATKVLERAAEYQETLGKQNEVETESREEIELADGLRVEYFAVRTALVNFKHHTPLFSTAISLHSPRHGVKSAWIQQSICSESASSSQPPSLPQPPNTSQTYYTRSERMP